VADRVHFGGYRPADLASALCAADAMVLPSEREGLANAWIEALACGTPLVITDTGSAREVLTDPAAGQLVERTPSAIAAAVRTIFDNPPDRAQVAAGAARFSWQANARQLTDHYRRLVGRAA
jgi:teichuronic acid biosynthesis glycosyltransferase TuaC